MIYQNIESGQKIFSMTFSISFDFQKVQQSKMSLLLGSPQSKEGVTRYHKILSEGSLEYKNVSNFVSHILKFHDYHHTTASVPS